MPGVFSDTPNKQVVREDWNTPLLRHLNHEYGFRYRYFGLPGPEIQDIILWQDMIDEVVAFEVAAPGRNARQNIDKLRLELALLGKESRAYYGPFEFVVIKERDLDNIPYSQTKPVTLYNLDFCDEIGSAVETGSPSGPEVLRYEALRKVLKDQADCLRAAGGSSWFIILLTVRDQMHADELQTLLATNVSEETAAYRDVCSPICPFPDGPVPLIGTHTWAMKAFLYNTLRTYLAGVHVKSLFFPMVTYSGARTRTGVDSPMLHLMLLCELDEVALSSPRSYPTDFLSIASVRAEAGSGLIASAQPGETLGAVVPPVDWFRRNRGRFFLPAVATNGPSAR